MDGLGFGSVSARAIFASILAIGHLAPAMAAPAESRSGGSEPADRASRGVALPRSSGPRVPRLEGEVVSAERFAMALAAGDPGLCASPTVEAIDCSGASADSALCGAFAEPDATRPEAGAPTSPVVGGVVPQRAVRPGRARSLAELIGDTGSPDLTIRWHAVDALGALREPAAVPALVRVALHDQDNHPRWRALWALGAIDGSGTGALPELGGALLDPDPTVVRNAAVALAYFGHAEARPALVQGLDDADPFRRWEAAFSLRRIVDHSLAAALRLALADETDRRVRSEILRVLRLASAPPPTEPSASRDSANDDQGGREVKPIR